MKFGFLETLPTDHRSFVLKQVHGDATVFVEGGEATSTEGDSLATKDRNVLIAVRTADCVPILLYEPCVQIVAAIHAGWRGTALDITGKTIKRLVERYGATPEKMYAWIGPAIGPCCYEVDGDVNTALLALGTSVVPEKKVKWHADLKATNVELLARRGLRLGQIDVSQKCTKCAEPRIPSYRRDGPKSGRLFSFIKL